MQITCSGCNSNYSLTSAQVQTLHHAIFRCRNCGKQIKIAFCQHCNCLYSITFSSASSEQYRLTCRRCGKQFIVHFPLVEPRLAAARDMNTPETRKKAARIDFHQIFEIIASRLRTVSWKNISQTNRESPEPERRNDRATVFRGTTFQEFTLRELFQVCGTAFRIPKIAVGMAGCCAVAAIILLYGRFETIIHPHLPGVTQPYVRSFLQYIPVILFFIGYLLVSALISRITIEEMFLTPRWRVAKSLAFMASVSPSIIIANVLILFLLNGLFIVFGNIPLVGPIIYSLAFLPVYVFSLLILVLVVVGFWFYAPLVAYRASGIAENISNIFHFIRRHNLNLLLILPILTFAALIIVGVLYAVHHGAFTITTIMTDSIIPEESRRIFSAIPTDFLRVFDASFAGRGQGLLRSFTGDTIAVHHIGGAVIGLILLALTVFLYATFISVVATLSTHTYIMLERGIDMDDRKKAVVLLALVMMLAGIYVLKRILM